ncbi:twin-arginine translocase TatA/TatE family subunit [Helicobacter cetorum]|uniref:Sec-independent protein translocase protein TatA n=1 Tax=Helicobacter cetorum (strain ATCC BAA-429 / MIT 00-7128) TaxID=182217 RepID=I0ENG5_HELC0|nr:twin-arginine translocase TatA/TatE family subunit [Helicobacter cetorum]AFI04484.1 Sec-independent protein translocase protein tatA/E-like protein [Helicobacter cetorum MIT 00-7128]
MGGFTSIWHWVIVLLVIILLFGAKKIPELAKGLGSGIKNFKKAVKDDEEDLNSSNATQKSLDEKASATQNINATQKQES